MLYSSPSELYTLSLHDALPIFITFASTAATVMPLTTDHAAFASAVDVLAPENSLNSKGSSITDAGDELEKRMSANDEDRPENKNVVFRSEERRVGKECR